MYLQIKRIFDIFGSFSILIVALPLLIIISLSIYFFNGNPIFFKQKRIGKNGFEFTIYKFRSMRNSKSSDNLGNIEKNESIKSARRRFRSTSINDKRITYIGKIIRSFHLDELPQIFNVVKGDMSLVGPRPDVKAQMADYTKWEWKYRHSIRPGITGFAQISKIESNKQRLEYDLTYINKASFLFDLKILFLTFIKIFKNRSF